MTLKQKIGKTLYKIIPITTENLNRIRFEFRLLRIDLNNKINPIAVWNINKISKQSNLKINLGAGPFGEKGWINIDTYQLTGVNLIYNCRKKLPFKTNSAEIIRCEHVFEHLDIDDEVPFFLQECLRCLKPNGVLRVVVPDISKFVHAYILNTNDSWNEVGIDLNKFSSSVSILNHVFRQGGEHKFGYDFEGLKYILNKYGFQKVIKQEWGKSINELLINDLRNHKPYSLYVDCIK